MQETITQKLADFAVNCTYDTIPEEVLYRFKAYILDYIGVALDGSKAESGRIMAKVAMSFGDKPESVIIGCSKKVAAGNAAMANGTSGHARDFDDDHRTSVLHPAVVVIPAALAMCEREKANGKKFIEAVVVGYELTTRIGDAFLGSQHSECFQPTGTCGVFGAAAAAGKALGLNKDQIVRALGIAGSQSAGLHEWKAEGSWTKHMHPGKAAHSGILSAFLAREGFTGPASVLEGDSGFLNAFSIERKWDKGIILDGLKEDYRGFSTSFKPYACCRFVHSSIDSALKIVNEHKVMPEDIVEITVKTCNSIHNTLFHPHNRRYQPETIVDAQFSMPFTVATAILRRRAQSTEFTVKTIKDPQILELASRIKGIGEAKYEELYPEKYSSMVTIETKNGENFSAYTEIPSGDPENIAYQNDPSLFNREVAAKFEALMSIHQDLKDKADKIQRHVDDLENLDDINDLTKHLIV